MFPSNGLINPPVESDLEVGLRYRERRKEFFLGGPTLGSLTNPTVYTGVRNTSWGLEYSRRVLYLIKDGVSEKYLDMVTVSELTACMDSYMQPVIVYLQAGQWYIRFFDPYTKEFIVRDFGEPDMVSPRICYDDRRLKARGEASILVAYYVKDELRLVSSDNNYLNPKTIRIEGQEENYLSQIAMGDNGRLHFVTYTLVDE